MKMYIYKFRKEEICSYVIYILYVNFLEFIDYMTLIKYFRLNFIKVITYSVKILLQNNFLNLFLFGNVIGI